MRNACEKISGSELTVMRVLWEAGEPIPLAVLRERLAQERSWEPSTVKTLLRRLCTKGVVAQEKREVFYYMPLVSEAEYHESAAGALLDQVFGGSAAGLVASLVNGNRISDGELDELRRYLESRKGKP
ncbi:MAG: BlaI/MecI/CopY family transcriptional regulator [Clostridiaceae bacterium]|nr:BlaI/MecI/CopY family transcriptional regulator [Clostridiaceae bacterium]